MPWQSNQQTRIFFTSNSRITVTFKVQHKLHKQCIFSQYVIKLVTKASQRTWYMNVMETITYASSWTSAANCIPRLSPSLYTPRLSVCCPTVFRLTFIYPANFLRTSQQFFANTMNTVQYSPRLEFLVCGGLILLAAAATRCAEGSKVQVELLLFGIEDNPLSRF